MDQFSLSGETALITGGAGLLGPEHGAGLARYGCVVVLVDLTEEKLDRARRRLLEQVPNASVITEVADITEEEALISLRDKLKSSGIAVNILVNNAAINPKMVDIGSESSGTVENYDMEEWDRELNVGITGLFLCCKVFGSSMAARGRGSIINIASDLAVVAPDQRVYAASGVIEDVKHFKPIGYSVVKAAMLGVNRYLSTYWAHRGVRVNCLIPGAVRTDRIPDYLHSNVIERIPLRRWAERTEYQGAIAFLASSASSFMTGQTIVIDGGRTVW